MSKTARDGSYSMSTGAAIGGAICLGLTAYILHTFGKQLGTSLEGKQLLSWANVAVHILGFVFMGLAVGYFFNPRTRNLWWAIPCCLVMLSAGGLTFTNLYGFASGERISATKAVEDGKKRIADAAAERRAQAQKRQEAQERLAKSQLGFMQAEVKDASGKAKRQLTKDFAKNSAEIIAEIGKETTAAPAAKVQAEVDPDVGASELAALTGLTTQAVQVAMAMWVAKLLVALEMLLWPMASFTWPRKITSASERNVIDATYNEVPRAQALDAGTDPAPQALEPPQPQALLPQPEEAEASTEPVPMPTRNPLPGSEQSLAEIGFPTSPLTGPKRDKRAPKDAAQAFLVWLQAFDLVREPLTAQDVARLYAEFCEADHRHPSPENNVSGALKNLKGVRWGKLVSGDDGKKASRYIIKPGKYPKVTQPAVTENPKQEGRVFALFPRPLAEAPAHEPAGDMHPEPVEPVHVSKTCTTRVQFDHPVLNAARAKWMRRDARHLHRKQRGSRSGRRAA